MRRLIALSIAIFLFAAACGDSEGNSTDDTTTPSEAETTTTSAPAKPCSGAGTLDANGEACLKLVLEANFENYTLLDTPEVEVYRMPPVDTDLPAGLGECPAPPWDAADFVATVDFRNVLVVTNGVVESVPLTLANDNPTLGDFYNAISALSDADDGIEADSIISFDYVLWPAMRFGFGTGDDPTPSTADFPAFGSAAGGKDGSIVILDTGLPGGPAGTWPKNIVSPPFSAPQKTPPNSKLDSIFGHGLMVASVAARIAPDAEVTVVNAMGPDGFITAGALLGLTPKLAESSITASVLNMSFGTYGCAEPDGTITGLVLPEGLEVDDLAALELIVEGLAQVVAQQRVIAAAGNDNTDRPFYPAAFPGVIGVGAIDTTRPNTTACVDNTSGRYVWSPPTSDDGCQSQSGAVKFSNGGENVSVMAPGVDLVVDYPTSSTLMKTYIDQSTAALSTRVRVSGTSLAAPYVAACLVAPQSSPCAGLAGVIDQLLS
jgi:Subtilase family